MEPICVKYNEETRIVTATIKTDINCYKMGDSPFIRETFKGRPAHGNHIKSKTVRIFVELFYREGDDQFSDVGYKPFSGESFETNGVIVKYWNGKDYIGREDFDQEDVENLIRDELGWD